MYIKFSVNKSQTKYSKKHTQKIGHQNDFFNVLRFKWILPVYFTIS